MNGKSPIITPAPPFVLRFSKDERRVFQQNQISRLTPRSDPSLDRMRIKKLEFQLAAKFLGADIEYQGRPLHLVHAKHPIMGGHFARRRQILTETLEAYDVPPVIQEAWLAHTDSLRPLITPEADSDCDPVAAGQRARRP